MKTVGERRVRVAFNPGNDDFVTELKQRSADLIDLVAQAEARPEWDDATFGEFKRLQALAMTHYEMAAMWAVKMATL